MDTQDGLIERTTLLPPGAVLDRLEQVLRTRGIRVFTRIDHAAEAARAGLSLPATQVLVFGNPRAGTPLMVASPHAAFDLPLRVLAWTDGAGQHHVAWPEAGFFARRWGLQESEVAPVAAVGQLVETALQ